MNVNQVYRWTMESFSGTTRWFCNCIELLSIQIHMSTTIRLKAEHKKINSNSSVPTFILIHAHLPKVNVCIAQWYALTGIHHVNLIFVFNRKLEIEIQYIIRNIQHGLKQIYFILHESSWESWRIFHFIIKFFTVYAKNFSD